MRSLFGLLAVGGTTALCLFFPSATAAQAGEAEATIFMEPAVTWQPDRPGEGRLFVLRVAASEHTPLAGVHGTVGPEELHFTRAAPGVFESFAAVPVGSGDGVGVSLRFVFESGRETRVNRRVPVTPGAYRHEELSVAPRFASPLDSADQAHLDRDRAMARDAARQAHRTPRIMDSEPMMPRDSRVTSGFGDGRLFNGQLSSRHMGLDLQGFSGDTVYAAAGGVVSVVAPFLLAGNVVYLNHGAGILSGYFHLSEQLVAPGDTVAAGDPVGRVGATGRVTGPHLHWVVRYGETSVDPRSLLEVVFPGPGSPG